MYNAKDNEIIKMIEEKIEGNGSFWDFKNNNQKKHIHGIVEYPATMVPNMQQELINIIMCADKNIRTIMDPFMGSGTVLVEGILKECNLIGIDINPLAFLITKVKLTSISIPTLYKKIYELFDRIDSMTNYEVVEFTNIDKWFKKIVIRDLSKIKASIMKEESIIYRRIFWVCFSEIIKLSCNSRKTTFKLHIKKEKDIEDFNYDCVFGYKQQVNKFYDRYCDFENELKSLMVSAKKSEKTYTKLYNKDSISLLKNKRIFKDNSIDLICTSPPYGDNHTTVTYGQYSVLQLMWINLADIDEEIDFDLLKNFSAIDSKSLGGINYTCKKIDESNILEKSHELSNVYNRLLSSGEAKKARKVASFYIDFEIVLRTCFRVLRKDRYAVFTVGNRRVNNQIIEFNKIICELADNINAKLIYNLKRNILNKRTPSRLCKVGLNETVRTMKDENIIIFRKV